MSANPLGPGESLNVEPEMLAAVLHDARVDYGALRQEAEGTGFAGSIDVGNRRYRYRAVVEGSAGYTVEDEQQVAGNFIADVRLVDGSLVFEGCIPGRFRVLGPVGATRVQADSEPYETRRWFRWRSTRE